MARSFAMLLMLLCAATAWGQQISIVDFAKYKKDPTKVPAKVPNDKKNALLHLLTDQKGFTFKADGKTEIEAEEGEGRLILALPDKTTYLTVEHPDFGQTTWKAPLKKGMRRKRVYKATLIAFNPDKPYKVDKQWVVMRIEPKNAIVTMDSTTVITRDGKAQFVLPIGKHEYKVETPFYKEETGTVEVSDSTKTLLTVNMQPIYSYITVRSPRSNMEIYIDNERCGTTEGTSRRLAAGTHRVTLLNGGLCYYDAMVDVGSSEKVVLELKESDMKMVKWTGFNRSRPTVAVVPKKEENALEAKMKSLKQGIKKDNKKEEKNSASMMMPPENVTANVKFKVPDDSTEIWIDRQCVSKGSWQGTLQGGYHAVNTVKDGIESKTMLLWVNDNMPIEMSLGDPMMERGYLNVHSNVIGASIWIDGKFVGLTPCVVTLINATRECEVELWKGQRMNKAKVRPKSNDMVDVNIELETAIE